MLTENTDDITKCKSTNTASADLKKLYQKPLFSNNDKSISHSERKKRPDICVTENYIKNFTPVTAPGNINYVNTAKNGRKILPVGDSHVKRISRIDFNKELRNGKAYFRWFNGATSK